MTNGIYSLILLIVLVVAWATTHAGHGLTIAVALFFGMVLGLFLSRLMSQMIIMTEANAFGKRRHGQQERQRRQHARDTASKPGGGLQDP